jgi:hypothetical protein
MSSCGSWPPPRGIQWGLVVIVAKPKELSTDSADFADFLRKTNQADEFLFFGKVSNLPSESNRGIMRSDLIHTVALAR